MKINEYSFEYAKQFHYFLTQGKDGVPVPGDLVARPDFMTLNRPEIGIILWSRTWHETMHKNSAVGILWSR